MTKYLLIVGLIFSLGCKDEESVITIVDIGHLDRVGIAKELTIINKYSPKVIGLDFLLTTDSLDKDIPLSEELSKTKNLVQASKLHNNDQEQITNWDSLERYHPKFRFGSHGFSNITITDDFVFVRELPMRQYYRTDTEFAFSYLIANEYDSRRVNPKYKNGDNDFSFDKNSIGRYFKVISVKDLMTGNFDKKDLTDKIVLMGHVSDTEDSFYLDDKKTKRISGVEIQASIIKEILD
jgi:CHASE2 domain-containing sensor protein